MQKRVIIALALCALLPACEALVIASNLYPAASAVVATGASQK